MPPMFAIRIVFCCFFPLVMSAQTRFSVALPAQEEATALDGRLLIMLALAWAGGAHHVAAAAGYCFD